MARKKAALPPPKPKEPTTITFETFSKPDTWAIDRLKSDAPLCFNGDVEIRRWRITVEPIEEPVEVLRARLLKLWRETDNHHHRSPLKAAAARIGYDLPSSEFGADRNKS